MNALLFGHGVYRALSLAQRIVTIAIMAALLGGVGFLTWSALDRDEPVSVLAIRILPPVAAPGQPIDIEFTILRHRVCAVRGEGYIHDGAGVRWAYEPTALRTISDTLGRETYAVKRMLPSNASPGRARYRISLYHVCPLNPIHLIWPITDVAESASFEIARP